MDKPEETARKTVLQYDSGAPRPILKRRSLRIAAALTASGLLASGLSTFVARAQVQPLMGSSRSTRLIIQDRQAEIEQCSSGGAQAK